MQDTHAATNGIDTVALASFVAGVAADPAQAGVRFDVLSTWQGGTRSRAVTQPMQLGKVLIERSFEIEADEPPQLLGADQAPNPQELLMAALNACMTVGYVANAAAMGIRLDDLQIRTSGRLDLRGFLGLDPAVNPGYDEVRYEVSISRRPATRSCRRCTNTCRRPRRTITTSRGPSPCTPPCPSGIERALSGRGEGASRRASSGHGNGSR